MRNLPYKCVTNASFTTQTHFQCIIYRTNALPGCHYRTNALPMRHSPHKYASNASFTAQTRFQSVIYRTNALPMRHSLHKCSHKTWFTTQTTSKLDLLHKSYFKVWDTVQPIHANILPSSIFTVKLRQEICYIKHIFDNNTGFLCLCPW